MRIRRLGAVGLAFALASVAHHQLSAQQQAQLRSIVGPNGHVLSVIPGGSS